jgi:hypothetical protein
LLGQNHEFSVVTGAAMAVGQLKGLGAIKMDGICRNSQIHREGSRQSLSTARQC